MVRAPGSGRVDPGGVEDLIASGRRPGDTVRIDIRTPQGCHNPYCRLPDSATPAGSNGIAGSSSRGLRPRALASSTPPAMRRIPIVRNAKARAGPRTPKVPGRFRANLQLARELGNRRGRMQWSWASQGPKVEQHEPTRNGNRTPNRGIAVHRRAPHPRLDASPRRRPRQGPDHPGNLAEKCRATASSCRDGPAEPRIFFDLD